MPKGFYKHKKGYKHTEEWKKMVGKKISQSKSGNKHHFWGKHLSEEHKEKLRKARAKQIFTKESRRKGMETRKKRYGYIISPEGREKIRQANLGSKSHFWKGGISKENECLRKVAEYKLWRKAVFGRDNFTCQKCNISGGRLHPHHIFNFADYPELRFAIDNGITLCIGCHKLFHKKFGVKNNTKGQLEIFIH